MLKARFFTALALVIGLLATLLLLPPRLAALVFIPVTALGAWEWGALVSMGRRARGAYALATAGACLLAWLTAPISLILLWLLAALFWLLIAPWWLKFAWPVRRLGALTGWLVLLPAWAGLVGLLARDPWLLVAVMAAVWVADVAAYATG
ncbi:MAG: phosphatidate cytidylyltransferase, partial [Rhodocyclaceae bacterium]|nr:phosphatidate cytidylyltransferase [Rhodocyclaceae bacterium]